MQTFRDAYEYRHVLLALTSRQLKAQYRSSALGFLWTLLNPMVMIVTLSLVWVYFFESGPEQPSRIVVTLIPYNFFAYCLTGCTVSVTGHASLVKKIYFPRQILPFSIVASSLVHLLVQSLLIVAVLLIFPTPSPIFGWQLLWVIPLTMVLISICMGAGLLTSALTVVYRDTEYIVHSTLTIFFWITPVIYDAGDTFAKQHSPEWAQLVYFCNPLAGILECYRGVLFHGRSPDLTILALAILTTAIIGAVGIQAFYRLEKQFSDYVR